MLFGRYRSQISDHNRSSYNVHARVFVVLVCELEQLNASSLELLVHSKHTNPNCNIELWCVQPIELVLSIDI